MIVYYKIELIELIWLLLILDRVVGSILTVVGLYGFLWGQKKEMEQSKNEIEEEDNKADLELQL